MIITNLTYSEYDKIEAINMSKLKDIKRSPKHFWSKHIDPNREPATETEALRFGKVLHKYILEPEAFLDEYAIAPTEPKLDTRTNAGKSAKLQYDVDMVKFNLNNQGKEYTTAEEIAKLDVMRQSIMSKECGHMLSHPDLVKEVTLTWTDPVTGLTCKGRLDIMIPPYNKFPNGVIVDLKSTQNASSIEFAKSAYNFDYHNSAAFYCKGFQQIYSTNHPPAFIYIAIEKELPYEVAFFVADIDILYLGEQENNRMLATYKQCLETNSWHGYTDEVLTLNLPPWAKSYF